MDATERLHMDAQQPLLDVCAAARLEDAEDGRADRLARCEAQLGVLALCLDLNEFLRKFR